MLRLSVLENATFESLCAEWPRICSSVVSSGKSSLICTVDSAAMKDSDDPSCTVILTGVVIELK